MPCPACQGERRQPAGSKDGFQLYACDGCTLVYVDPPPGDDVLAALYQRYRKTGQYTAKLESKYRRARRRINRLCHRVPGRRFLDVGCNVGYAVAAASSLGLDAIGIDIDCDAIERARALFPHARFEASSLRAVADSGRRFDIVYCSEVIEHLRHPRAFVELLAAVLNPGGILYLTTPDMAHWSLPRDRLSWDNVRPPEHLLYFSKPALSTLLRHCGFGDVRCAFNLKPTIKALARKNGA